MNKSELVAAVAERAGTTKKISEKAINATTDTIIEALANGICVRIQGFGIFEVKERAARMGRNPKTKEPIEIPASKTPVFKSGKSLKDAIAD